MDSVKAPPWVWGALLLIGLASVGVSLKTSNDTGQTNDRLEETQRCQTAFLAENSRVSKLRSAATGQRDEAINHLLDGITKLSLNPDPDPERARETYQMLLSEYRVAAKKLRIERAKSPLPDLPASCSDLD